MKFGQAIDDAGELLTLLGLLGVIPVVFLMTQNITNPDFNMIAAFETVVYGVVFAITPAIFLTLVVASLLWVLSKAGSI